MNPRIVLSIAGSDPSGGAGIQADLKTFAALGVYGAAALAGVTVQNTQGVRAAFPVDPALVREQVEAVIDDLPVAATKLGMLSNAEVVKAVASLIEERRADFGVIVLDPVMVATSGDKLLQDEAIHTVRTRLLPLADVITPNLPEAGVLLDAGPAADTDQQAAQALALRDLGARAVLVKGGHLDADELTDVYASAEGLALLSGPRIRTRNTHGTGCTLSSAIAAQAALNGETIASGVSLSTIEQARDYLQRAIQAGAGWALSRTPETGHGPVDHLVGPHDRGVAL